ncbi:MAG: hypothetical protein WCB27_07080 [Thermoguttaceae bacterium]
MKPTRPTAPPPARGSVRADELMLFAEAARRLGWCAKSRRYAQRDGLRVIRYGRHQYVLGRDLLDFFNKLADQGGEGQKGGGND